MQPKNLIAGPHSLFQAAPSIELANFARPCVPAFYSGNKTLANVKFSSDIFLFTTHRDGGKDIGVSFVQYLHSGSLSVNDPESYISFGGLDEKKWANHKQECFNFRGGRYREAIKSFIISCFWSLVFLNPPKSQTTMNSFQSRSECIRQSKSNPTFIGIDLNAPFSIKESCYVATKGIFAKMFHDYSIDDIVVGYNPVMAVPCMAWIGEKIAAAHAMGTSADIAA